MDDNFSHNDLEKIARLASHRTISGEKQYSEQEILNALVSVDIPNEIAEKALQDYKAGALSADEKNLLKADERNLTITDSGNSIFSYIAVTAKQFVERVKQASYYLAKPLRRAAIPLTVMGGVTLGGAMGFPTIDRWWNATDYALEALSKYDKPMKIRNVEEAEEVVYWLDEIIEEYSNDVHSDFNSGEYFNQIEDKFSIKEATEVLNFLGKANENGSTMSTQESLLGASLRYLNFIKNENISSSEAKQYLELASVGNHGRCAYIVSKAINLYLNDHKN